MCTNYASSIKSMLMAGKAILNELQLADMIIKQKEEYFVFLTIVNSKSILNNNNHNNYNFKEGK